MKIKTVLNQNLDAVQIPQHIGDELYYNVAINNAASVSQELNNGGDGKTRVWRLSSTVGFMYRITQSNGDSVALATAREYVPAGTSVFMQVPGSRDVAATRFYMYLLATTDPTGNVAITEVK